MGSSPCLIVTTVVPLGEKFLIFLLIKLDDHNLDEGAESHDLVLRYDILIGDGGATFLHGCQICFTTNHRECKVVAWRILIKKNILTKARNKNRDLVTTMLNLSLKWKLCYVLIPIHTFP